jgi:hypothetical protein
MPDSSFPASETRSNAGLNRHWLRRTWGAMILMERGTRQSQGTAELLDSSNQMVTITKWLH